MNDLLGSIVRPTMLLDAQRVRSNIQHMAAKAQRNGVRFRPHFKTHQSAEIGAWFRAAGVTAITASSLDMATYFADHGWHDITVAFPVNVREIDKINALAQRVRLHLLVENLAAVHFLATHLVAPVAAWMEVDAGYGRSGIPWHDQAAVIELAKAIVECDRLSLQGLLTHDGTTYRAAGIREIRDAYDLTVSRLEQARGWLMEQGYSDLELSIGDTPACSVLDDFSSIDEMRPGNFVFYDLMQLRIGSCTFQEVGMVVACPVVSIHPDRCEIVLYGGAVHLSKDHLQRADGSPDFGAVVRLDGAGWSAPVEGAWVSSLSQEHGLVRTTPEAFASLSTMVGVGGLLGIVPVHSCLTADLMKHYLTLDGQRIDMAQIPAAL